MVDQPRHMVDQQCSPLKLRDVTPDVRDMITRRYQASTPDLTRDISHDVTHYGDEYIEVVELQEEQIVIAGRQARHSQEVQL